MLGKFGCKRVERLLAAGDIFQFDFAQRRRFVSVPQCALIERQLAYGIALLQQNGAAPEIHRADHFQRGGERLRAERQRRALFGQNGKSFGNRLRQALVFLVRAHPIGCVFVAQLEAADTAVVFFPHAQRHLLPAQKAVRRVEILRLHVQRAALRANAGGSP